MFIVLLSSVINASNHTKRISLSNQKCKIQPTLINLYPDEYSQNFTTIHFRLNQIDALKVSCNTVNDLSNKVCVSNKPEDLNTSAFNMITGINESKKLTKYISWECKCKFDGINCDSDQW